MKKIIRSIIDFLVDKDEPKKIDRLSHELGREVELLLCELDGLARRHGDDYGLPVNDTSEIVNMKVAILEWLKILHQDQGILNNEM
jgi:predicted butyrate kinase (DUF1464 family)